MMLARAAGRMGRSSGRLAQMGLRRTLASNSGANNDGSDEAGEAAKAARTTRRKRTVAANPVSVVVDTGAMKDAAAVDNNDTRSSSDDASTPASDDAAPQPDKSIADKDNDAIVGDADVDADAAEVVNDVLSRARAINASAAAAGVIGGGGSSSSSSSSGSGGGEGTAAAGSGASNGGGGGGDDESSNLPELPPSAINNALARMIVPETYNQPLPVLVVSRRPVFPGFARFMDIKNPDLVRKLEERSRAGQPYVGVFLGTSDDVDNNNLKFDEGSPLPSNVFKLGSFAVIREMRKTEAGTLMVLVSAYRRIRIQKVVAQEPFEIIADNVVSRPYDRNSPMIKATQDVLLQTVRDIMKLNPMFREQVEYFQLHHNLAEDNAGSFADFGAATTSAEGKDQQEVLEELDVFSRLNKALLLLKKELVSMKLQSEINRQVEDKVQKTHRRYMLTEQLKAVKKELGLEKDDKDTLLTKYRDQIKDLKLPDHVQQTVDEELNKLAHLEAHSSEFSVTRNYLDWLCCLPWGVQSKENLEIARARAILDEDHYGMNDVKERILEFIAVAKIRGAVQGKILCLVGPPGVGKTSIARSIARSLNREYYRFSVGGLTDVAEIKGHRRTYVGAMPGKIVQCLKKTKTENPLILIDEIDKLGRGHQGDPASALLELLDPEQNKGFLDHYLDLPIDLSKVLFVCTANVSDTIPGPLLDRMEIMRVSGYVLQEKIAIAKQYLLPEVLKETGLTTDQIEVPDATLELIASSYCRESGVRNLLKHLEKIYRKVALKVAQGETQKQIIAPDGLHPYIGNPVFNTDRIYDLTPPGVVMGLAWTAMGGSTLYIESTCDGPPSESASNLGMTATGQLGEVMKESSRIAFIFSRNFLHTNFPDNKFFKHNAVHLHVPEGATPKDGPSAGCTMITSFLSLALGQPVPRDLAMTGEVSLTGKILPVGGIKEKVIAARRANVTTIILPEGNRRDFNDLAPYLTEGLNVKFAVTYVDVFSVVFPEEAAKCQGIPRVPNDVNALQNEQKNVNDSEK